MLQYPHDVMDHEERSGVLDDDEQQLATRMKQSARWENIMNIFSLACGSRV